MSWHFFPRVRSRNIPEDLASGTAPVPAPIVGEASKKMDQVEEVEHSLKGAAMKVLYVPPFDIVKSKLQFSTGVEGITVATSYDALVDVIKLYLRGIQVDEEWYFKEYPDVKEAVSIGLYKSAAHHFVEHGYFEGRLPFPLLVCQEWYLSDNEDIAEGIRNGEIPSAVTHFRQHGYLEGRLPCDL